MDIFNKIEKDEAGLGRFRAIGHGYFTFPILEGELGPQMKFRGKNVLNWSLNNYLGLANHPEVRKVDAEAAKDWGMAYPMGSRMLTGNTEYHEEFERQAAAFMGTEDAYLINFGYQAMSSAIQCLVDRHDVIVYDQLSHSCILDGMAMSLAKRFVYRHNDMEQLEDRLIKATRITKQTGGGILVITEGVFGMKGDTGNLGGIAALKEKYNFRFFVDDAHGFGVMGKRGTGTPEHYGVMDKVDVYFTTFAKSMAGIGGFFAGDKKVCNFLKYNARSQVYAKSLPMPMVMGALKRLELLRDKPEIKAHLWTIVNALRGGLKERGFDTGIAEAAVTPVYLKGGNEVAANLIIDMRENMGIFLSVITFPVIERGEIMLRMISTAAHSLEDVKFTLDKFEIVRDRINSGVYERSIQMSV